MSWWSRVSGAFRADRVNREIDEELRTHLEEAVERGRSPEEARRAFGSALRLREESRDTRVLPWLNAVRSDVVFAWRQLRKHWIVSTAAVLSLGLAMGACVGAFRLIDAMLLRPLPVAHPERLYVLGYPYTNETLKTEIRDTFDYPQFQRLRDAVRPDADLVAVTQPSRNGLTFSSEDQSERFWQQRVSGTMFAAFGLKPALGRFLTPADDVKPGAHPVAVLSYDYWQRRFGGDPNIVGRKFTFGRDVFEIVGVCQKDFTGTDTGLVTDIFMPTMMNADSINDTGWSWVRIWVQARDGVGAEALRQKLKAAVFALRQERMREWGTGADDPRMAEFARAEVLLQDAGSGYSVARRDFRKSLLVLGAVVALVLLIAVANVANLMTARAVARAREMAVRVSLGAGRMRLLQLCMVESAIMALASSMLGGVFAAWAAPFVVAQLRSTDNPIRLILPPDLRVLGFGIALTIAVTLLFGLAPAWTASNVRPMSTLRGETRRTGPLGAHLLLGTQAAVCFLICLSTAVFVGSFEQLTHQPTGFVAEGLLTMETVTLQNARSTRWLELRAALEQAPGVKSVALCSWALLAGNALTPGIRTGVHQWPTDPPYALRVTPGWLDTMGIARISGRDLRPDDVGRAVLVNEAFARRFFDGRNPVGQHIELRGGFMPENAEIVGLTADARYLNMRDAVRPTVYAPFDVAGRGADWATFVVRSAGPPPLSLVPALREAMQQAGSGFRIVGTVPQTELVARHVVRERLLAMLSTFFGVVAVVLAAIGLFGVLHYSVIQRRREVGIRLALGAPARDIAWRMTGATVRMIALGAALGAVAGVFSQRWIASLTFGVKTTDPAMLAWPALVLLGATLIAAIPPVIHALRTDPTSTLRAE